MYPIVERRELGKHVVLLRIRAPRIARKQKAGQFVIVRVHDHGERIPLTIAGSDSGGGAGIQADLKTFHAHRVFGTSAITCITAQNPDRVSAIQPIRPDIVAQQIARVCEAFPVGAAKTGMLYDAAIIAAVADTLRVRKLVVDPVMVATSGARLLKPSAVQIGRAHV